MEPHVLRAALSAAIRVTVSTSLLGCGGATVGEEPRPGQSDAVGEQPSVEASPRVSQPPRPAEPPRVEVPAAAPSQGGAAPISVGVGGGGGVVAAGGAGGGAGGAPPLSCAGPALQGCSEQLEQLPSVAAGLSFLPPADLACCQLLVSELDRTTPPTLEGACRVELDQQLQSVRVWCCPAVHYQGQACAPWGPPVPPELELAQLLAWEAAA